jgi:DNA-binding beta-propeller fold protein YncE
MRFQHVLLGLLSAVSFYRPAAAAESNISPAAELSVTGSIPGPDGGWDYASVDATARRLYVAHGDAVMAVDLDTGKVNPKLVEGKRLHAVAPLPDGKALSTNGGDNTATLFEASTGKVIASIATGKGPDFAIFDAGSGLALVMNGQDGSITLIDPKTAKAVGTIDVGGKLEFAALDGHGRAYVNVEDRAEMAVLDIGARKLVTRYPLTGCEEPSGLAINPDTGVLVAACRNKTAIAMQSKDGKILATLPIGERPDTTIFDAQRKLFFIPCGEGSLTVIAEKAGDAPSVVGTIPTAAGARTGALDPKTGKIYLPTADFQAPAPGEKRHSVIPGTFRIVVVGEK